jgi:hypothetical protein
MGSENHLSRLLPHSRLLLLLLGLVFQPQQRLLLLLLPIEQQAGPAQPCRNLPPEKATHPSRRTPGPSHSSKRVSFLIKFGSGTFVHALRTHRRNPRLESKIAISGHPIRRGGVGEGEKILDPTSPRRPGLILIDYDSPSSVAPPRHCSALAMPVCSDF